MIIAINSTPFIKAEGNDFLLKYFVTIALSKPEHQFIFITPLAIEKQAINAANIKNVISSPKAGNYVAWKFWLDYTLPAIIKKYAANILIHTDGACSLRGKARQYLFITDLSFLYVPQFFSKLQLFFFKRNIRLFLEKATSIITTSDFLAKEIMQRFSIKEKKIHSFLLNAGDEFKPIDWNEKEVIKEKYSGGKEYFLFSGEIHPRNNLLNLLKAFSFFKNRQKSNMQLIITAHAILPDNLFLKDFKTYKYRSDVKILTDLPETEIVNITGAAYAFIYPVQHQGVATYLLQSMQCGVPVVTSNTVTLSEIAGDAALYANAAQFEDIADKMMLVFKDETKRAELIKMGCSVIKKINESSQGDLLWNIICKEPPNA